MTTSSPVAMTPMSSLPNLPLRVIPSRHRRTSSQSVASTSPLLDAAPAYLAEWSSGTCVRTPLPTPEDLRAVVPGRRPRAGSPSPPPSRAGADVDRRLLVLRGLPADHLKALRASVDIDPSFIEAHAARRRYRPVRWRRDAGFACLAYPELVAGFRAVGMQEAQAQRAGEKGKATAATVPLVSVAERSVNVLPGAGDAVELMPEPSLRAVSDDGDTAAAFCRASLWVGGQTDVLLVDRPFWKWPAIPGEAQMRKARRATAVTRPFTLVPVAEGEEREKKLEMRLAVGDEIASFEDVLYKTLKDAADGGEGIAEVVSEVAFDHWAEFFEVLAPHPQTTAAHDLPSFYGELARMLELNAGGASHLEERSGVGVQYPDWGMHLATLDRRVRLLELEGGGGHHHHGPPAGGAKRPARKDTGVSNSSRRSRGHQSISASAAAGSTTEEENQQALNRVSYLGGLFLPFSIVSGILSMSDPFGPQNDLFWVFWAAVIPVTLISILVIYADIIRKAEVWVEVAAEGVQNAVFGEGSQPIARDSEPGRLTTWYRLHKDAGVGMSTKTRLNGAPAAQALKYAEGDEAVVIDMAPPPNMPETMLPLPPMGSVPEEGPDGGETDAEDGEVSPNLILVERTSDGSKPKAWRRQQLGWYGAVKTILGYTRPRRDSPVGVPSLAVLERRKTSTY
jgi:hypothetical protein